MSRASPAVESGPPPEDVHALGLGARGVQARRYGDVHVTGRVIVDIPFFSKSAGPPYIPKKKPGEFIPGFRFSGQERGWSVFLHLNR